MGAPHLRIVKPHEQEIEPFAIRLAQWAQGMIGRLSALSVLAILASCAIILGSLAICAVFSAIWLWQAISS